MICMDKKNETTSVKITKTGSRCLDEVVQDSGVGKIELVSRMAEWLSNQDKSVRAIVLGQIDSLDESSLIDAIKSRLKEPYIDRLANVLAFKIKNGHASELDIQKAVTLCQTRKEEIGRIEQAIATLEANKIVSDAEADVELQKQRKGRRSPKAG